MTNITETHYLPVGELLLTDKNYKTDESFDNLYK